MLVALLLGITMTGNAEITLSKGDIKPANDVYLARPDAKTNATALSLGSDVGTSFYPVVFKGKLHIKGGNCWYVYRWDSGLKEERKTCE